MEAKRTPKRQPMTLTAPWKNRIEVERRLSELFRSRAPDFEIPLKVLADAGVPKAELIIGVLSVAVEHDSLVKGSRGLKKKLAVEMRKLARLADKAAKFAKELEPANEMVFAQLHVPEQLTDWHQEMLALPAQLNLYAGTLRYLLAHAPRRHRGRRYLGEAYLCRWVQLMAGEKFYDALYAHLAELLQHAAVFWHPDQEQPARDHFSAEALKQRIEGRKRGKQEAAP